MRIPNIEGINAVGEETSINPHIPIRISDTELIIFPVFEFNIDSII